jgi:hypothetical protein
MIFSETLPQVLDGTKTQTRRLVKDGDFSVEWPMVCVFSDNKRNRLRFRENQTYAVQPGRGKHAVGRIGIVKIRKERLQDISEDDCRAEGILVPPTHGRFACVIPNAITPARYIMPSPIPYFAELWDSIHPKGKRWADNPEVWMLEFELIS